LVKKPKKDELITFQRASVLYGFTADYFQKLARRRRLKAKKIGVQWFTTPADVEEFIGSREPIGVYRKDIKK
jgi:hypothetical protein